MKLKEWMEWKGKTYREVGEDINICHTSLFKYCNSNRVPRKEAMKKIKEYTKGRVTLKDFIDFS